MVSTSIGSLQRTKYMYNALHKYLPLELFHILQCSVTKWNWYWIKWSVYPLVKTECTVLLRYKIHFGLLHKTPIKYIKICGYNMVKCGKSQGGGEIYAGYCTICTHGPGCHYLVWNCLHKNKNVINDICNSRDL